jgi:hypothetical protein
MERLKPRVIGQFLHASVSARSLFALGIPRLDRAAETCLIT